MHARAHTHTHTRTHTHTHTHTSQNLLAHETARRLLVAGKDDVAVPEIDAFAFIAKSDMTSCQREGVVMSPLPSYFPGKNGSRARRKAYRRQDRKRNVNAEVGMGWFAEHLGGAVEKWGDNAWKWGRPQKRCNLPPPINEAQLSGSSKGVRRGVSSGPSPPKSINPTST